MKTIPLKQFALLIGASTEARATVNAVSVDSRLTKPGDVFFALPGANADGHFFIAQAAAKGACAAVVRNEYTGPDHGILLLRCADTLIALQNLAKALIKQTKAQIVGITGSLGKTTTKDFLAALLNKKFIVSASPGNSNSQIGLPLAIINHSTLQDEVLILEMGMTHPGQISQLIQIAPPSISLITSIALVHACNFESLQDIARAKAEIFSDPFTKLGIYPEEFDIQGSLSKSGTCSKLSFSTTASNADYLLMSDKEEMKVRTPENETIHLPKLRLLGDHNKHNFLAAALTARCLGMSWEEISHRIALLELPERRMQIVEKFGATFLNDSYNASELSLKAALSALPPPSSSGKRIAVIGEMLELGKFSRQCHQAVGEFALQHVDLMFCLGENCAPIYECWQAAGRPVFWEQERQKLVAILRAHIKAGDVVLLKGSRAKGLWNVLAEL